MDKMSTLLSLMLLEKADDKTIDTEDITDKLLELSDAQKDKILDIFEKYLIEIIEIKKLDLSTEEINKVFDKIIVNTKKKVKKVLTLKQLDIITDKHDYEYSMKIS